MQEPSRNTVQILPHLEGLLADIPMPVRSRSSWSVGSPLVRTGGIYSPQDVAKALTDIHAFGNSQEMVIASLSSNKAMQEDLEAQKQEIQKLKGKLSAERKEKMDLQEEVHKRNEMVQKKHEDMAVAVDEFFVWADGLK